MWPFGRAGAHIYYVCYNQITYVVACEHATHVPWGTSVMLVATDRIVCQPRYAALAHRRLNRWQIILACLKAMFGGGVVIYVPHHNLGRLLKLLLKLAWSVRLVDDGLDTLRERPKNVRLDQLGRLDELLTFKDYASLATWTDSLAVTRVCSLSVLLEDVRPPMDMGRFKMLVVQSPGVEMDGVAHLTDARPSEVFVFVHSNPTKRSAIPSELVQGDSKAFSLERTIEAFDGTVVGGETMVTVAVMYQARRGQLIVQLSNDQYNNLHCMHEQLATSGARLMLH